jgi:serine kinase of HPr protein (carbohydrate metabolism regulator)
MMIYQVWNYKKNSKQIWARISKILKKKTNSNIKIVATFYKVIVQGVLLHGSETWV